MSTFTRRYFYEIILILHGKYCGEMPGYTLRPSSSFWQVLRVLEGDGFPKSALVQTLIYVPPGRTTLRGHPSPESIVGSFEVLAVATWKFNAFFCLPDPSTRSQVFPWVLPSKTAHISLITYIPDNTTLGTIYYSTYGICINYDQLV